MTCDIAKTRSGRRRQPRPRLAPKKTYGARTSPCWDPIWSTLTNVKIHTHPHLAKVWRRKGQPIRIPAAGKDQKGLVSGARGLCQRTLLQTYARKGKTPHDFP